MKKYMSLLNMKNVSLSMIATLGLLAVVMYIGNCTGWYATSKKDKYNFAFENANIYAIHVLDLEPISIVGIDCGSLNNPTIFNGYIKCKVHHNNSDKIITYNLQCNTESIFWGGKCIPISL